MKYPAVSATVEKGQVTHPYLLTPKALIIAQGGHAIDLTDEDIDSYCDWIERRQIVEYITLKIFPLKTEIK
jgi:hypothetical protein